jgi:hypothetical protein
MSAKNKKISLDTAKEWTQTWRKEESDYNRYNSCNGFLVPAEDLRGALDEIKDQKNPQYIRAYLGVETMKTGDGKAKQVEKLIIVGTRPATNPSTGKMYYEDILPSTRDAADSDGGGSIWDFSEPCPPECDEDSDLN